jgi:hypothetical protein
MTFRPEPGPCSCLKRFYEKSLSEHRENSDAAELWHRNYAVALRTFRIVILHFPLCLIHS